MNQKILLAYPPGKLYQRGEDRCQGNIEDSAATSIRACNDLGYAAAVLLQRNYSVLLRDYQTEKASFKEVTEDITSFQPDMVMISVTNATIYDDIEFALKLKELSPTIIVVLKGSIFYDPEEDMLSLIDLSNIDYLIGGECELAIGDIADYEFKGKGSPAEIDNILYKDQEGRIVKTKFHIWFENLDTIPFPARQLMNNALYVRPDTNEPMATIQTSRGCAANCIYCLSPTISGKSVRFRSVENVMQELAECYEIHHIRNFFFKADTFTINAEWVKELCSAIMNSPLAGKISFTANSRVNPLKKETLELMKRAGCFSVAFGFESGSDQTLKKICKGATVAQNIQAAKWAKEVGLPMYGFYMIGFPWEREEDLHVTGKHIFEIDADFIEIHIALPYYGTKLYQICHECGTLTKNTLGSDYFHSSTDGTEFLTMERLIEFRRRTIGQYYLRPKYIVRKMRDCIERPYIFKNYVKYGLQIVKKTLFH